MVYGAVMMDSFKGNQPDDEPSKNSTGGATDYSGTAVSPSPRPVIEVATYADTDVYECYIRGFESRIVMRRTQDDWINITQVFKIAQFSKTQRTKVLEKESNDMRHEKVQGGYGRFQGTWIPLEDAKYMVTKYNIKDPVVTTILAFQLNPDNPPMKRSKNSVLKRTSPDGRIASPSSYNKTPKKKNQAGGTTTRKTKKNGMLLHANPSPLQNLVFQTPQQAHMSSQLATNAATTVSATSQANQLSSTKENPITHLNTDETPLTLGYSATQKPLQFYPVPTSLTHPHKARDFTHGGANDSYDASTDMDKPNAQNFLTFVQEGPNSGVFTSSSGHQQQPQQRVPSIVVNGNSNTKKVGGKRKKVFKNEDTSIDMLAHEDESLGGAPPPPPLPGATPGYITSAGKHHKHKLKNGPGLTSKRANNAQDKVQQNFKMMQKQVMWQSIRQQHKNSPNMAMPFKMSANQSHSNNSSLDMFSTGENPTPISSSSSTPTTFAGLPTAPATAHEHNLEGMGPPTLTVEEYKEMILQVLSSEDGCDKDYQLPPQMYHPPPNFDIDFEIDDQGHTPLHWATAMANIPLIKLLIALNANALQCNLRGFNCITKSAFYNNCYKANTFSDIVAILRICLITPDSNGRLPLHYLVELSVNKSKDPIVINFYMDTIIHNLGQEDYTLLRMCLNFQDSMGNTVLHLAALNLNLELCNKLCYLGSSMDITNCDNETPASILAKFNLVPPTNSSTTQSQFTRAASTSSGFPASMDNTGTMNGTPRSGNQSSSLSEDSHTGSKSHKLHHNILPSVDEDDTMSEKHEHQMKLTPSLSNKKTDLRNFLPGADSTSLSNLMDDLSSMNSLVTSSVLRDVKTTPSKLLESSPITRKKKQGAATASSNLKKSVVAESIQSPLGPIIASPDATIQDEKEMTNTGRLTNKLGEISKALKISINAQVSSVTKEIESAAEGIDCIKQNVLNVTRHEKDLLLQFNDGQGVESMDQMESDRNQMREYVRDGRQVFVQCLEKSQALNLATLVQEEESRVDSDPGSSPTKEGSENISLKLAAELALLQFKRRLRIQRVTDARTKINSDNKISKYRRLIGMTIENIDTKLDDIEVYLKASS